jgi:hypothetical protein
VRLDPRYVVVLIPAHRQVVGVLAAIDQGVRDSKQSQNEVLARALQRQGMKCASELDMMVVRRAA